jgi:hypothetical protein
MRKHQHGIMAVRRSGSGPAMGYVAPARANIPLQEHFTITSWIRDEDRTSCQTFSLTFCFVAVGTNTGDFAADKTTGGCVCRRK